MGTLTVINENGEIEGYEVHSKEVSFRLENGDLFTPAVSQRVEFDEKGVMSKMKNDTCNKTVNRREGSEKADITIEGIVTESQLEDMKSLDSQRELTFVSDIYSGEVVIQRLSIEQTTDLVHFTPDGGEQELAFSFHLQIKEGLASSQGSAINPENTVYGAADDILAEQ